MERWCVVPGTMGYAVSDLGRVRNQLTRRVLRPGRMPGGHLSVVLGRKIGSKCVHTLVLEAFVGPAPSRMEARHLDGNPANNRLGNLCWGTRGDNMRDVKHHTGRANYKLSPGDVRKIKSMIGRQSGVSLARQFGVSQSAISAIKHNRVHIDV